MKSSNKKYYWRIGEPPPPIDKHSETKHAIIEEYVRRYILTMMSRATIPLLQLSLIDGFCGGGNYTRESGGLADGSPIRLMQAVRQARAELNLGRRIPREVSVDYHFNDLLPDTTDYLRYWLNGKFEEGCLDIADRQRHEITTGDFLAELPRMLQKIKSRRMGEHAIFVLDQYDYDDIPLPQIANVLNHLEGAEVILTFNIGSLITYLSDRAANRKPLARIGLDQYIPWERIGHIKSSERQSWRRVIQRHIANGIRAESGAKFMTLFFVKPHGVNTWDYWLIHLSNRYRAHDVMKTLHWEHATEFGHELEPGVFVLGYDANQDSDYTGQSTLVFGESSEDLCVDGVREYFGDRIFSGNGPVLVGDLLRECVGNSMGAESHLLTSMGQLHRSKNIVVSTKDGRIRRPSMHYNNDDIVEANRQIILIK
ncbi:three-Cys-motif partner protein TcmP [Azovibrio restrictus]|uniref:three-Cys-motif partner protein TcmP n=1 Tax=Azovibrio restrictus TaxID=146938 RepID=UPI0005B7FE2D|nr:three-Cys-motif partner protein TcmP [Azovibrio restrictus]